MHALIEALIANVARQLVSDPAHPARTSTEARMLIRWSHGERS